MQFQQHFSHWLSRNLVLVLSLMLGMALSVRPAQAATISVTNTNDSGPGSLRQAIANAAAGDTVRFNLPGCPCTITLTSGELVINKNLIIAGPGAQVLTVSGNHASRVFHIPPGTFDITISDLTVANGVADDDAGGAIRVRSNGAFNLINATVMNSRSLSWNGGGLDFRSAPEGGNLSIVGSTFSGNSAKEGGAIHLESGTVHIRNTTISGNTANGPFGGGISNWRSNLTIANSTITGNSSTGTSVLGSGGGVINLDVATITVLNSIIAGNSGVNPDVGDNTVSGIFVSRGNNLIGNNQGAEAYFPQGQPNANGDIVGTSAAPVDPMLAPLADNSGPTPTLALMAGSPAINAGNPATPGSGSPACELTDQRGYSRSDRCDIGAFELNGFDLIPPTANPSQSPVANSNGWNNSDVTVTWNWNDSGTGIDSENCTPSSASSGEGTHIFPATCKDKVGNAGSAEYTVKVDKTAPTINAAVTTSPNGAGWYSSDVTVHFTCADGLSGVASCPADQLLTSEGAAVASTAQTIADLAGNSSAPSNVVTVKIDKTAPTINAAVTTSPNGAGWYNSDVTVHFTCADGSSGVASCPADQLLTSEGAAVASTAQTASDLAGNTSAASNAVTVQIDKTTPVVAVTGVSDGASYPLGGAPAAGCDTTDAPSGVATQATVDVNGGNADGTGSFTATCSGATDTAGNSGSASVTYSVLYNWTGFFQPVDNLPTVNTVNAGQVIPIKFSLGGDFGLSIFASGYPASQKVSCGSTGGGGSDPIEETVTPGASTLQYDPATQTYSYIWKTDKAWAGTCRQLIVRLSDGSEHIALFQFAGKVRSAAMEDESGGVQQIFLPLVNR